MDRYLFDTDVIIDYLRGNETAIHFFDSFEGDFHISVISIAELYSGVKGEQELKDMDYFISIFSVNSVTKEIAVEAGKLRQNWHKSHGMGLADALIAATAGVEQMKLFSLNEKHFRMLKYLEVPYQK
ncbi:type II toxin-antitoxin system VapC family toxin [Rhodohalobacter sp.]|uniref:type II toxin-antitoxin system VapC family toxin n=1 Tax=Rhodohalobacter sp. TaxID=1974210 RepID=UPI002ACE892B|nr:type II toxin-antitoxin system VapC family toxin [Rhodohalobacter sp.]MDZ7755784.1 type II toxin-antitoxin system VapC family toxin [Rhodohalobacter sp.]